MIGHGRYGVALRVNNALLWLLDATFVALAGLYRGVTAVGAGVLATTLLVGAHLRDRIAASDRVADPMTTQPATGDPDAEPVAPDAPVLATAVRLDRKDTAA